jgi:hypothetical protein
MVLRIDAVTPAPKRRWFRYSLRTLFVVVTVFGCWLGGNLHKIRQRDAVSEDFVSRGARFLCTDPESMPFLWRFLGVQGVHVIWLPDSFDHADQVRAERLFPESTVVRFEADALK